MHRYETAILSLLKKHGKTSPSHLEEELRIGKDSVMWAIEELLAKEAVTVKRQTVVSATLTDEGRGYANSFPEENLVKELARSKYAMELSGKNQIALIWAKKNGWIAVEGGKATLTQAGKDAAEDKTEYAQRTLLTSISKGDDIEKVMSKNQKLVGTLLSRKLVVIKDRSEITEVDITDAGIKAAAETSETGAAELTREMITRGAWKNVKFRPYDVKTEVEPLYPARMHPVREFINYIRSTWVSMGFVETSGPIVESAFWNFDSLFSPQDHPSRDMQDTFFISNPKEITIEDLELLGRVRKMHQSGWKETWDEEVAREPLLRTHTTSVSAHNIQRLANAVEDSPLKLFSVGKVFRNESIDYKHLAEFHHCDGIIIGKKLGMAHLIHTLKEFYTNIGLADDKHTIRIKPAYFPFVEPGIEIQYRNNETGEEIELNGAGVIRKEITRALGTDRTVLAWGIGLDRMIFSFMKLGLLSELYDNNVGWLRKRDELKI